MNSIFRLTDLHGNQLAADKCTPVMFLRAKIRKKDGKKHRYFSMVENQSVRGGRVVQRHVMYLEEINSSEELAWRKSIEVLDEDRKAPRALALFPDDPCEGFRGDESVVRLRMSQMRFRDSGVGAGLRCSCGGSWSWMSSGLNARCRRAKARVGARFR